MENENKVEEYMEQDVMPTYCYESTVPTSSEPPKKKSKAWEKWVVCICMALVFGLVSSIVFLVNTSLGTYFGQKFLGGKESTYKTVETTLTKGEASKTENETLKQLTDVSQVAANVMPSVVSITNLSVQEVQSFFFGGTTTQESESRGSGIIIGQNEKELLVVSNNHVVQGSKTLTVSFVDGTSVEAIIKGTDAAIDLAIVAVPLESVDEKTLEQIKIATIGDSDALAVGEPAIAIGNALGYGQSVTSGIISALNRELSGFDTGLIQTDAAINPGNSGGALLNQKGEVIGINTVKVSGSNVESMGYAIPISDVSEIINELMNREIREKVDKDKQGSLGISGIDVDETVSEYYDMPQGVYVKEVIEGGAAEKAGIVQGSIITKFEGTSISSMDELRTQLEYYEKGEKVKVELKVPSSDGGYKSKTVEVKLGGQSILKN